MNIIRYQEFEHIDILVVGLGRCHGKSMIIDMQLSLSVGSLVLMIFYAPKKGSPFFIDPNLLSIDTGSSSERKVEYIS